MGEDEADPSRGTVSYVSPLARAVLTHRPGETVKIAGSVAVILNVRLESVQVSPIIQGDAARSYSPSFEKLLALS